MPGLDWDLNLPPDLQPVSRRLSFSDSPSASASPPRPWAPGLPGIPEDHAAEAPRSPPGAPAAPSRGSAPPAPSRAPAPASSPRPPAPPAPSRPRPEQQQQQAVAAAMTPEQLRQAAAQARALFGEYWRRLQAAAAHLQRQRRQQQQAWALAAAEAAAQSQLLRLYTVAGGPAGYETRWEELHPVSQGLLLHIEDKMREYKYESQHLAQCSRLHGPSLDNRSFEFDASQITQEAQSISTIIDREKVSVQSLKAVVKEIMRNTDFALLHYVKLKPRFVDGGAGDANSGDPDHSGSSGDHTFHCYTGAPKRPSPFVQHTVARFEERLGECCKWIVELEQLIQLTNDKTFQESLDSLSVVLANVHDYLIHVASKVEDIHQYVETVKTQDLNDRWHRGDCSDPSLKADRRAAAKQESIARLVHPTLKVTAPVSASIPMVASQMGQPLFPNAATSPRSCPTLATPSVFFYPVQHTNKFCSINPFSSSRSPLQPTPFGSASALPLGSTAATFLCGASIPSSATSLFPRPSGVFGGAAASSVNH
ncbi:hypothetical protein ACP4OV_008104 [Aristida adscensionis]